MQRTVFSLLIGFLFLFFTSGLTNAAANPIASPSARNASVQSSSSSPAIYLNAVKVLRENNYGENELKSFVYQVFSLFDRHAAVNNLLLLFADNDLLMRLPEGQIDSHQEFEKWYSGLGTKYQSKLHTIERLNVQIPARGDYRIDLIVLRQALDKEGNFTSTRTHQQWKLVDGGGYWPRIVSYISEPVQ